LEAKIRSLGKDPVTLGVRNETAARIRLRTPTAQLGSSGARGTAEGALLEWAGKARGEASARRSLSATRHVSATSPDIQRAGRQKKSANDRLLLLHGTFVSATTIHRRPPVAMLHGTEDLGRILVWACGQRQPEKPRKTRGFSGQAAQAVDLDGGEARGVEAQAPFRGLGLLG
jgi:hypothetical protein